MTKAEIQRLRGYANDRGLAMIVSCDNGFNYFHNTKDQYPIIWDDTAEMAYATVTNTSSYNQSVIPLGVMCIPYDYIQYIEILMSPKTAVEFYNSHKSSLTETEQKSFEDQLAKSLSATTVHRGYAGEEEQRIDGNISVRSQQPN